MMLETEHAEALDALAEVVPIAAELPALAAEHWPLWAGYGEWWDGENLALALFDERAAWGAERFAADLLPREAEREVAIPAGGAAESGAHLQAIALLRSIAFAPARPLTLAALIPGTPASPLDPITADVHLSVFARQCLRGLRNKRWTTAVHTAFLRKIADRKLPGAQLRASALWPAGLGARGRPRRIQLNDPTLRELFEQGRRLCSFALGVWGGDGGSGKALPPDARARWLGPLLSWECAPLMLVPWLRWGEVMMLAPALHDSAHRRRAQSCPGCTVPAEFRTPTRPGNACTWCGHAGFDGADELARERARRGRAAPTERQAARRPAALDHTRQRRGEAAETLALRLLAGRLHVSEKHLRQTVPASTPQKRHTTHYATAV